MMKKQLLFLSLLVFAISTYAQQFKRIYLFDDFTTAEILFKNHSKSKLSVNYDASNKTLLFRQGSDIMEVTNTALVDTVYINDRKFVPAIKGLYEVVPLKNGIVYIDWLLKDVNIGSKGALGAVTQGSVQNLQMSDFGNYDAMYYTPYDQQKIHSTDVYKRRNDNTYYIRIGGKLTKIKTQKHLEKAFPAHKEDISNFADQQKVEMNDASHALTLINYCLGFDAK